MRNWWLAAIAGLQGNAPSSISPEGPIGVEGAGGIGRPGCGTGEIGRPGCGARGLRHSWAVGPDNEPKRRAKVAARTARGPPTSTRSSPGPTAGPGTQKTRGSTSNNQRHTATRSVLSPGVCAAYVLVGLARMRRVGCAHTLEILSDYRVGIIFVRCVTIL